MDLTTLALLGSLIFGLVVGDAVVFGDSLYVTVNVPDQNLAGGPSEDTAEAMFGAEVSQYTGESVEVKTPSVEISSQPRLTAVLARPLGLEGLVYAAQSDLRDYGVVGITATITRNGAGPGLRLYMVVNNPPDPPLVTVLTDPAGDWRGLIRDGAREAMVEVAPYRVARVDFRAGTTGDPAGFSRCRETIERGLAQPWDPREQGATENALLYNLSGLLKLVDKNTDAAVRDFIRAQETRETSPAAKDIALLNQAFVAVAERRPDQAVDLFRQGAGLTAAIKNSSFDARVKVLEALVAWSGGDRAAAEADFRAAIRLSDDDPAPHEYLAELLEARGETDKAKAERAAEVEARRYDPGHINLAHTLFRVDPVNGGYQPLF